MKQMSPAAAALGTAPIPSATSPANDLLEGAPAAEDQALLKLLKERLRRAGCFVSDPWFLIRNLVGWSALAGMAWWGLLHAQGIAWLLTVLAGGLALSQLSLLGHDAGHLAAGRGRLVNDLVGYFTMNIVCGIGFGHWRRTHNEHHRRTQQEAADPDMRFALFLSVYPKSAEEKVGIGRFLLSWQAYYFWPLTVLYPITMRTESFLGACRGPSRSPVDVVLLILHYCLWLIGPALVKGVGPAQALFNYWAISAVLGALSAAIFSTNHIGMPTSPAGQKMNYLKQQVEGSRNVRNPPLLDFFFGGLNYQIEHHIFPSMARNKLRLAQRIARPLCLENGLAYREEGFFEALGSVVRHLKRISTDADAR